MGKMGAFAILCVFICRVSLVPTPTILCMSVSAHAPLKPITIDRFLMQGVNEVAWILNGVLYVADGVCATTLAPHALLGSL